MKVISTNVGDRKTVVWNGKNIETGIYKEPTNQIFLGKMDVLGDSVVDRKYHGGIKKACYLYSANHYEYWKKLYPKLKWNWGMFGENITIEGLDEKTLIIDSEYKIGSAIIKITEPREPCYKLGIRFGTQKIIKQFIQVPFCGSYVMVLKEGEVSVGDTLKLIKTNAQESIATSYLSRYGK